MGSICIKPKQENKDIEEEIKEDFENMKSYGFIDDDVIEDYIKVFPKCSENYANEIKDCIEKNNINLDKIYGYVKPNNKKIYCKLDFKENELEIDKKWMHIFGRTKFKILSSKLQNDHYKLSMSMMFLPLNLDAHNEEDYKKLDGYLNLKFYFI